MNMRNNGQILQGKQEQLESDRGVPLDYILVGVVLNTPPRLHLAHIFLCGATLLGIRTQSLYRQIYLEFSFPLNSLIISTFNLKRTKIHLHKTLRFQQHCTILFDSIGTDLHLLQYFTFS